MEFAERLRLIDERSAAFRAAIAAAPSLDVRVPTCPEWTLLDLAQHLGAGRLSWAATVAAGPASAKAVWSGAAPTERPALLQWLAESTRELLTALRAAGPDRECWTWWDGSQSPPTTGAVARHQLQEIAVHTYDAQSVVDAAEPLPDEVALDGVDDFLFTCVATDSAWPHPPAIVDYHASEGRSWRLRLSADGARIGSSAGAADASAEGTAAELVLVFYGRLPLDALKVDGDRRVFEQLIAWDPDA